MKKKKAQYGYQDPWQFVANSKQFQLPNTQVTPINPQEGQSYLGDQYTPMPTGEMQIMPLNDKSVAPAAQTEQKNSGKQVGQALASVGRQAGQMLQTAIVAGVPALANLIKDDRTRVSDKIEPAYNPFPMGTGSQAIWEDGGEMKMPKGGKVQPLYVDSPSDPRYRAYQDSFNAYNKYGHISREFVSGKYSHETDVNKLRELTREASGSPLATNRTYYMNQVKGHPTVNVPFFSEPVQPVIAGKSQQVEHPYYDEKTYNKIYPPIYVSDPKDPRIGQYAEEGNQYVFKPKAQIINKITPLDSDLNSDIPVPQSLQPRPVSYKVQPKGYHYEQYQAGPNRLPTLVTDFKYGGEMDYKYDGKMEDSAKSGIHIKPENKGKFTEYKKRTGKTTEEALHSKDPHVRQMANFARNAKKWNHGEYGLEVENGGNLTPIGANPYTGNTLLFQGKSHNEGGIDINYFGKPVEVQGGEPAFVDRQGDLNVLGAMEIPGSNKTFQSVGKKIGKAENKANKELSKGLELLESDPTDRFAALSFNTGRVLKDAANQKLKVLAEEKESLANIQNDILSYAEANNISPKKAAKGFARSGIKVSYDDGKTWNYNTNKMPKDFLQSMKTNSMTPQIEMLQQRPIPTTNDTFNEVGLERLHDSMGNYFYSPIFPKDYTRSEIEAGLTQLPNTYNELPLINTFGDYREYNQMKDGGEVKARDGKKESIAVRHNNPGNMKYAAWMKKYGAKPGKAGVDGGNFAEFPDVESGQKAMAELLTRPLYANKTVMGAIKTWTNNAPYAQIPANIRNKKVSELSSDERVLLYDTITKGEDSKGYNWTSIVPDSNYQKNKLGPNQTAEFRDHTVEPIVAENSNLAPIQSIGMKPLNVQPEPIIPEYRQVPTEGRINSVKPSLADRNKLGITDFLGEIPAIFDRPDFVQKQTFEPTLYDPYSVSFQDRLNANNASFRSVQQQLANNPEALSVLAGQKYNADNSVLGEQYRTNQAIQNDVINKNIALLNQAELQNIQLADQQYVRQEQAKANTNARRQQAAASISDKIAQNKAENVGIRLRENLFNYRPDADYNLQNYNPEAQFFTGGTGNEDLEIITIQDGNGNTKQIKKKDYPAWKDQQERQKTAMKATSWLK